MAPRKKATSKEEVQVDIEDVTPEQWEEAHAINQELDEAIELETEMLRSDYDYKLYELLKVQMVGIRFVNASGQLDEMIRVGKMALDKLGVKRDE